MRLLKRASLAALLACAVAPAAAQPAEATPQPGGGGAQSLAGALATAVVSASFAGRGASSGDAVFVTVTKLPSAPRGTMRLTVEPGLKLRSGRSSEQNMVVAAVRGRSTGAMTFHPESTISLGDEPATYVLEAYCAEFEKGNPTASNDFSPDGVDQALACVLAGAAKANSPTRVKQAAVWIVTDRASYAHINSKFQISQEDWKAARGLVTQCGEAIPISAMRAATSPDDPPAEETPAPASTTPAPSAQPASKPPPRRPGQAAATATPRPRRPSSKRHRDSEITIEFVRPGGEPVKPTEPTPQPSPTPAPQATPRPTPK